MEQLLDILHDLHADIDFRNTDHLIEDGILDSLDIVALITEIKTELDVSIPPEEIVPENFDSARAIWDLICRIEDA